jgi:murein DD-endopeptidase MepM/ murein hydrolase activator NlpD
MGFLFVFKAKLVAWAKAQFHALGGTGVLALSLSVAIGSLGIAEAAVRAAASYAAPKATAVQLTAAAIPRAVLDLAPPAPAWEGRDIDGDGAPDFANPTGAAPRGHDRFGDGYFHASRDGGARAHEGVDYDSRPGQDVAAPISGYVARIGYAYPGDERFKYVEIDNPALHLQARVFYIDPHVAVGESVELGRPIGTADSLQGRYAGITDHVHLEIEERGRKIDAQTVILAKGAAASVMAAMN